MNASSSNMRPSGGRGSSRNRKHRATISTMGRGLILLGIATTTSSVDAFTSCSTSAITTTAIQRQSSCTLKYRYGNDDDKPMEVLSAIRRRRSHHVSTRPPSTTTTPSPPTTVELEQELDEYIEYLDRRYTRIHPKRSTSIGRLGLSNLASTKLRQRLHVVSTTSATSSSSALVFTSYMRQVSDKFISSIKSMTSFFSINQVMASVFSATSLVALLLVRPLLFGTFRQG